MFVNFSEETKHILKQAEREKESLNHPYVGSEHLFLSILKSKILEDVFKKHNLTYEKFKTKLIKLVGIGSKKNKFMLYTPLLKKILENVVIEAREENSKNVNSELLILSILDVEDGVAYSILRSLKVNIDKLYFDIKNKKIVKQNKKKKLLLEEIGTDLTKLAKEKKLDPVIGREDEIKRTIEILIRRKKNNPILIGPAGVGKTAIVEGIANLIVSNKCPSFLKDKRIISLNIFSIVSGTKYRGEFEEKMKNVIKELETDNNIILFIDEIHTIVGAGGAEGAIDASNILKPALARGSIRVIGATTNEEYKKYIEPDAALSRRFQKVRIEQPDTKAVIKILTEIKTLYEKYHGIQISHDLIKEIALLSKKHLTSRYEPDRSIDILDEVCAKVSIKEGEDEIARSKIIRTLDKIKSEKLKAIKQNNFKLAFDLKNKENFLSDKLNNIKPKIKKVTKNDILSVIRDKASINIFDFSKERNYYYINLEKKLNELIIGQKSNVDKMIKNLKKHDISQNNKCNSILISGKIGCGKTYLANTYLKLIMNNKNIIKIDGTEYSEPHSISKLLGTTAGYLGYDNKHNVLEKIRTNPNSAILFENIEDACYEVQNLFSRILEENKIEDNSGKLIDFSHVTIIFTTTCLLNDNRVGFNNLKQNVNPEIPKKLLNLISLKINMEELNKESVIKIMSKKIKTMTEKYESIKVKIEDSFINELYQKLSSRTGISKLDIILEEELETKIVDAILDGKKELNLIKKEQVIS